MPETTTQEKQSENFEIRQEAIVNIALSELYDFPNHPFKVRDDEAMQETAESIRQCQTAQLRRAASASGSLCRKGDPQT